MTPYDLLIKMEFEAWFSNYYKAFRPSYIEKLTEKLPKDEQAQMMASLRITLEQKCQDAYLAGFKAGREYEQD